MRRVDGDGGGAFSGPESLKRTEIVSGEFYVYVHRGAAPAGGCGTG